MPPPAPRSTVYTCSIDRASLDFSLLKRFVMRPCDRTSVSYPQSQGVVEIRPRAAPVTPHRALIEVRPAGQPHASPSFRHESLGVTESVSAARSAALPGSAPALSQPMVTRDSPWGGAAAPPKHRTSVSASFLTATVPWPRFWGCLKRTIAYIAVNPANSNARPVLGAA